MRKRVLSKDITKLLEKLDEVGNHFDVKETTEYKKINSMMSDWMISCLVEETITSKGDKTVHY